MGITRCREFEAAPTVPPAKEAQCAHANALKMAPIS